MDKNKLLDSIRNMENKHQTKSYFSFSNTKSLVINLSEETFSDFEIPQSILLEYLGGKGLALRLWAEFVQEDVDNENSYEADNPVVFANPFMINSGKPELNFYTVVYRSPVTGGIMSGMSSTSFGECLDHLGYKALILIGRLRRQTVVKISNKGVSFSVSELYVGKNVNETDELLNGRKDYTSLTIGTAGENKIQFASLICEKQFIGRGGLGYIFGLKNIKSLLIQRGKEVHVPADSEGFYNSTKKIQQKLAKSNWTQMSLIQDGTRKGWIPVANFTRRMDPRNFHLQGDELHRKYEAKKTNIFESYADCRYVSSSGELFPGYATTVMLGPNLDCFDMECIIEREKACLDQGIDSVSVGNIIGWFGFSEGFSKAYPFDISSNSEVLELIENISSRTGIGKVLSLGVKKAATEFGNEETALHTNGLECGPFDFRGNWAQSLLELTNNDMFLPSSYSLSVNPEEIADNVIIEENIMFALNCIGFSSLYSMPFFEEYKTLKTRFFKKRLLKKDLIFLSMVFSSYSGIEIEPFEITEIGRRCWHLKNLINKALGFNMKEVNINDFFQVEFQSSFKQKAAVPWHKIKFAYLKKRLADE